jgi:hypothetical protein
MFLKPNKRCKDGKQHIYYTLTESLRVNKRRTVQRTTLHLGELTTSQHHRWRHTLDVTNERSEARQCPPGSDLGGHAGDAPHAPLACGRPVA